jgi:hypothetical protein
VGIPGHVGIPGQWQLIYCNIQYKPMKVLLACNSIGFFLTFMTWLVKIIIISLT